MLLILGIIFMILGILSDVWKTAYKAGYDDCIKELEANYTSPVEKNVIDTLYITRDSIIYKTKYIKQIEHDTIEKVYNLSADSTVTLFYRLVSE